MDNKENLYDKAPFYMTYPLQNLYVAEMEYERDLERMHELYPREVQKIQEMVSRRCDELEHEGSRMYDENPDRLMMEKEVERLYKSYQQEPMTIPAPVPVDNERKNRFPILMPMEFEQQEEMEMMGRKEPGCGDSWLCSLISVIFNNEVYRRRCRNRRCRRWSM